MTKLFYSTRSARGAMMGMVRAACPELEVTIRLKQLWNRYINSAPMNEGTPASAFPMVYKIVFSVDATFASDPPSTRRIPLAIPTTTAVPARSARAAIPIVIAKTTNRIRRMKNIWNRCV